MTQTASNAMRFRRRWFQFSLAEWLILTTLLAVGWWQCTQWPVFDEIAALIHLVDIDIGGPELTPSEHLAHMQRKPTVPEIVVRGVIASTAIVCAWLVCSLLVRAFVRGRRP